MVKHSSTSSTCWTKILVATSVIISVILVVGAANDEYDEAGPTVSTSSLDARRTPPNTGQRLRRRTTLSNTNTKKSTNVQCGDFLDTDVTLFEDLDCNCKRGPGSKFAALTVVGPASLDLNNFSVRCENDDWDGETDLSAIIKVVGRAGVIKNGNVSRGNFGIVLAGHGHHTVQNVQIKSTANDGLQINAPFCEVTACNFRNNGNGPDSDESGDAIDIGEHSQYSVVQGNTMTNYGDDGLSCRGDYNIIRGNTISIEQGEHRNTPSEDGITINGEGNQIIGNTIRNTYSDGIDIKLQGFNILRSNTIMTSKDGKGIKIGSNDNVVVFNTVESMTDNAGFNIDWGGNRNYLADNISNNNDKAGFNIQLTNNNVIVRNTATGNNEEGFALAVKKVFGEVRGLAHIVAGNIAQDNAIGRDFREWGNDSLGDCTQNAYIGNRAPTTSSTTDTTTAANPSCMLGAPIDLSLQDDIPRTNAPTNKPTNSPTERREECENKKKYLFENKPGKSCNKWAAKGNRCTKQDATDEIGRRVSFFCPLQCNPDCFTPVPTVSPSNSPTERRGDCENKKQYLFENKPGRDCDAWAAKRNGSNRCKKEDTTDEERRLVSFFCPLQCNTDCFTPVPSAMPSSSPSHSPTNAPTIAPTELREGCENKENYLFENKVGKDCDKWATKKKHCTKQDTTDAKGRRVSSFCPLQCNMACSTPVPTVSPSNSPSLPPSSSPSVHPSESPSVSPSSTPSSRPSSNPSSRPSTSPSSSPSREPIQSPSESPSSSPSGRPSTMPSLPPSSSPSTSPSVPPSSSPSVDPSEAPSGSPSASPSSRPSSNPSSRPSTSPSSSPSREPSQAPSKSPSESPSSAPSGRPSFMPSSLPSFSPSHSPSVPPSSSPSVDPSESPSVSPSASPSSRPSSNPSSQPSASPSSSPSARPSQVPSDVPSDVPSASPSSNPSSRPSTSPSSNPNAVPSASPSSNPSSRPSTLPSSNPSA